MDLSTSDIHPDKVGRAVRIVMLRIQAGVYTMPGSHPDILTPFLSPMPCTTGEGARPEDNSYADAELGPLSVKAIHSM